MSFNKYENNNEINIKIKNINRVERDKNGNNCKCLLCSIF